MMKEITTGLAMALVSSGLGATEPTASLGGEAKVEFPDRDKLREAYAAPGWKLRWADEFEAPGLPDPDKWNYEEGRVRNNEDQYYVRDRRENARVEDGRLIITARKEEWKGADVTSAVLSPRESSISATASWRYGPGFRRAGERGLRCGSGHQL